MENGKIIACASTKLKIHEMNYPTHNLELAVVVFALKVWRHYFYGVHVDYIIDHKTLHYLFIHRDMHLRQKKVA